MLIRLTDYTLNNPDTLTKYKTAAQISHRVLEAVKGMKPTRSYLSGLHINFKRRVVHRGRKNTLNMRAW